MKKARCAAVGSMDCSLGQNECSRYEDGDGPECPVGFCALNKPDVVVVSEGPPTRSLAEILQTPPKLNLAKTPKNTAVLGTGRFWNVFQDVIDARHPDPAVLKLEDIAISLGNICRFGGHIRTFYSVADHSRFVARILISQNAASEVVLAGLVHDVAEIITGDVISPMKPIYGEGLKQVDDLWTIEIEKFFGLSPGATSSAAVKSADLAAYYVENQILRGWAGEHVQHLGDETRASESMRLFSKLWKPPLPPPDAGEKWRQEITRAEISRME